MARRTYLDFVLRLTRSDRNHYIARVTSSPGGEATHEFSNPFTEMALENFYLKISRPRRSVRRIGSPESEAARDHGRQLFETVFRGRVWEAFAQSMAVAASDRDEHGHRRGLRIQINLSETPELASLPWEYLWDPTHRMHIVTSERTPIVRYVDAPTRAEPLVVTGPVRMLCVICDPKGAVALDVEHEWRLLVNAVWPLVDRGALVIERLPSPSTIRALQRQLRASTYHILHFVGHGGYDTRSGEGILLFESESRDPDHVPASRLAALAHDHDFLRLVVLNACEGARSGREDIYSGTAQTLVHSGVPAVIGMQFEITDDAAIAIAQELYQAIASGYPIDGALGEARKALYTFHNDIEWGTPVLYMHAPDGQLFSVEHDIDMTEGVAAPDASPGPESVESLQPVETYDTPSVRGRLSSTTRSVIDTGRSALASLHTAVRDRGSGILRIVRTALAIRLLKPVLASAGAAAVLAGVLALWPSEDPVPGRLGEVVVEADEPIQIGSLQATGDAEPRYVVAGEAQRSAIRLAIEDYGDIAGHRIALDLIADDGCAAGESAAGAQEGAQQMASAGSIVGVIGPTCSSSAESAIRILSSEGLVLIAGFIDHPRLTTATTEDGAGLAWDPGFFRTAPNIALEGTAAATFAAEILDAEKALTIGIDERSRLVARAFENTFGELDGSSDVLESNRQSLADDLASVTNRPDVIYFYPSSPVAGSEVVAAIRQIPALEDVHRVSSSLLLNSNFVQDDASVGMFFTTVDTDFSENESVTQRSYEEVVAEYSTDSGTTNEVGKILFAQTYDAAVLLLRSIDDVAREDGDRLRIDRQELRNAIASQTNLNGVTGSLECNEFGDCATPTVLVVSHHDTERPEATLSNVVFRYDPVGR